MFSFLFFLSSLAAMGAALSVAYRWVPAIDGLGSVGANLLVGAVCGALFALGFSWIWRRVAEVFEEPAIEIKLLNSLMLGVAGAGLGFLFCYGILLAFPPVPATRIAQAAFLIACTLVGLRIGFLVSSPLFAPRGERGDGRVRRGATPKKILDTSIIIDGRIGSLLATGFVEGEILVPEFVLAELQNIADSSNSLRRRKGRRGLDVLNQLMQDDNVPIRVISRDYPAIREVDRKLIHLAKDESAVLITTDYNLNRVAQVEGVAILNVNELSNAVKPRYIPGEDISVEIIDRGEEINQGVGYLDDGTMVVVENGRRHIGRTIKAVVKSTLQTDAGRMLFVEPASENPRWEQS